MGSFYRIICPSSNQEWFEEWAYMCCRVRACDYMQSLVLDTVGFKSLPETLGCWSSLLLPIFLLELNKKQRLLMPLKKERLTENSHSTPPTQGESVLQKAHNNVVLDRVNRK